MSEMRNQAGEAERIRLLALELIGLYEDRGSGYDKTLQVLRYVAETIQPAMSQEDARKAFRNAARGYGRAGTADLPGGPDMSMDDAAGVYATLVAGQRVGPQGRLAAVDDGLGNDWFGDQDRASLATPATPA